MKMKYLISICVFLALSLFTFLGTCDIDVYMYVSSTVFLLICVLIFLIQDRNEKIKMHKMQGK